MKIKLDTIVTATAGLLLAVLPVLTSDGVIKSGLARDLGLAIGTFILGYHVPPGRTVGAASTVTAAAEAIVEDLTTKSPSGVIPSILYTAPTDNSGNVPDSQTPQG